MSLSRAIANEEIIALPVNLEHSKRICWIQNTETRAFRLKITAWSESNENGNHKD